MMICLALNKYFIGPGHTKAYNHLPERRIKGGGEKRKTRKTFEDEKKRSNKNDTER
jgi:hypothetical protein